MIELWKQSLRVGSWSTLIFLITIAQDYGRASRIKGYVDNPDQTKTILLNVAAGIPVGQATIGPLPGSFDVAVPVVSLPAQQDSFVAQSIALPTDFNPNKPFVIEVFFSVTNDRGLFTTETVSLSMDSAFDKVGSPLNLGVSQRRDADVSGRGLQKVTFAIGVDLADVLTVQIGRRAKSNPQDTNPGVVRIEAVRISYSVQ